MYRFLIKYFMVLTG